MSTMEETTAMPPPLDVQAPTGSNDKPTNSVPDEAIDEPISSSKTAADIGYEPSKLLPGQNQTKPSGSATPRDEAGDMQAEIKRLNRQIQDLKMIHQEEREQLEDALEEDYEFRSWSTREVKAHGMPFTRSHHAYVGEKVPQDFAEELDQVEILHYAREAERQAVQAWRLAHPGQDYQAPQSKSGPPSTSMLNRVPWAEFQQSLEVADQSSRFAVDVLVGEPNVKVTLPSLRYRTRGEAARYGFDKRVDATGATASSSAAANLRKPTGRTMSRGQGPLPERIRINSTAILVILSKIFQEKISTDFEPVLMMRPFRGLIWYKDEIRKWRDDLEKKVIKAQIEAEKTQNEEEDKADTAEEKTTTDETPGPSAAEEASANEKEMEDDGDKPQKEESANKGPDPDLVDFFESIEKGQIPNKKEEETDTKEDKRTDSGSSSQGVEIDDEESLINTQEALNDLNCLVDFIDHDLEDKLAYLANEECTKVIWSDIWHLFKPGDFVVSKDEKQAYRVIQVKYATHSMKPPTGRNLWMAEAKAKLDDSPITIQCVFLDFDGERIGPVTQTIDIHRYEGERSIRSLSVVPIRRAKNRNLKEALIKRGSMFIEACDPQRRGIPMHYSGLSLEAQEEIDSQVVIDFEEAFASNDVGGKTKPSGWTIEKLVLECFAGSIKDEMQLYLHDVQTNWKPEFKDINLGSDYDTASSYDSEGSDRERTRGRRAQMNRTCLPQCCSNENVHDDVFVEHNRSSEFVQSQFWEDDLNEGLPSLTITARPLREAMEDEDYITDEDRLITSYRVFGFIMRSRKWGEYHTPKLDLVSHVVSS